MKRRYTVDSDDDNDENEDHIKRPRTQHQRPTVDSADEDVEEDVEVDVEDMADDQSHTAAPSTSRKGLSRPAKPKAAQAVQKKRRLPAASDPDTEDEYVDRGADDEEDFAVEPEREQPLKGKGKVLGRIPRLTKGKATEKRPRAKLKGEDEGAGEPIATPDAPTHSPPSAKEEAPPPKKRKLPTIKKNKSAASTGPATPTTSTATTVAKPAPPPASKAVTGTLEGSILPLPMRKPAALAGQADFDLRNQDVYNSLFKNVSCRFFGMFFRI